ncbi:MAG: hypothetical protein NC048_07915 [Bacteroides sp.]|nr:hypothetical protein [Ruminococcus flavefaciens]MCM1555404.1 hypothetical protein [Bacteroides sp.]
MIPQQKQTEERPYIPTYVIFELDGEEIVCLVNRLGIFQVKNPLETAGHRDQACYAEAR